MQSVHHHGPMLTKVMDQWNRVTTQIREEEVTNETFFGCIAEHLLVSESTVTVNKASHCRSSQNATTSVHCLACLANVPNLHDLENPLSYHGSNLTRLL